MNLVKAYNSNTKIKVNNIMKIIQTKIEAMAQGYIGQQDTAEIREQIQLDVLNVMNEQQAAQRYGISSHINFLPDGCISVDIYTQKGPPGYSGLSFFAKTIA
jgi:hypothetical protein